MPRTGGHRRTINPARGWGHQVAVGGGERGDDGDVGGGHGVAGQLGQRNPGQGLAFVAARDAFPCGDHAHVKAQTLGGIGLGHGDDVGAGLDMDAQLFLQFADQGLFGSFAGFDLAAGEFPQAGEVAADGAARQQDAAARVGDGGGDDVDDALLSHGHRRRSAPCARNRVNSSVRWSVGQRVPPGAMPRGRKSRGFARMARSCTGW